MKKYFGALLLLPLVLLVMAQFAAAQDTMSAVLSTPYNSRPGSQLLYFFTESELVNGTFTAISGGDAYKSYMTITNTSSDTSVLVHYQFYNSVSCDEVFDYVDVLTPQDTNVIDPQDLRVITGEFRGVVSGGFYLLAATAIDATRGQGVDTRAVSFNYLTGQQFITNMNTGSAWGGNAISRMAVNYYGASLDAGSCFTTPKDFTSLTGRYAIGDATLIWDGTIPTYVGCNTALGGVVPGFMVGGVAGLIDGGHNVLGAPTAQTVRVLQMFQPASLIVPHFFAPGTVDATDRATSKQFGNRLSLVTLLDNYNSTNNTQFKFAAGSTTVSAWFIDNYEQPFSLPNKTITCIDEFVLSPRKPNNVYAGATATIGGIGKDFIGASIYSAVDQGGYIKMNVTSDGSDLFFGWFSQSLSGASLSAGVGDLLVGLGRTNVTAYTSGVYLPATEAVYMNSTPTDPRTAVVSGVITVNAATITP